MVLFAHKIVLLDTATLGGLSRDYWNAEKPRRDKARSFLLRLQDNGVFVTFTLTHVLELLRHANKEVVRDRLGFLRAIPLIAWLRPYERHWFPGGTPDLLRRELHAVVHGSARNWREIVDAVSPELWETGMGSELFAENDEFWSVMKMESERQHENEKHVASVARTDPGDMMNLRVRDVTALPVRPKEERESYLGRFADEMKSQLDRHGDRRLDRPDAVAFAFVSDTSQRVRTIDEMGGSITQRLLEFYNVPDEFVSPEMTLGELGALGVYASQLRILAAGLRPPVPLTMKEIPPDTLPSYVLERELASIQRKAERVSGSDLGDGHIAPLVLYADGVQVDKRTYEALNQMRRKRPELAALMGRFFRSPDYNDVLDSLDR